jgi:hypothetical protein
MKVRLISKLTETIDKFGGEDQLRKAVNQRQETTL